MKMMKKLKNKEHVLLYTTLFSVITGILVGGFFPEHAVHTKIFGDIFLNVLKMIVVPLIMVSMMVGIASLGNLQDLYTIGWKTIAYFFGTTVLAAMLGLVLVNVIQPGKNFMNDRVGTRAAAVSAAQKSGVPAESESIQLDAVPREAFSLSAFETALLGDPETGKEGLIPQNLFNAMVKGNILPLMFFSIFIGYALLRQGEAAEPVIDAIIVVNNVIMLLIGWIMYLVPIGTFGLIAGQIGEAGGFANMLPELVAVGKFTSTVLAGLFLHSAVVLSLLLWRVGGKNPFTFLKGMRSALLTGFSTASSSATLPVTMDCLEHNNGVSGQVSIFVLPLGATLNMNGAALAFAVTPMFIAQVYGITMGPLEQCIVVAVASLMAISAASAPGIHWMTLAIVVNTLQLPIAGIALVIAVDWLLERSETVVNIWGDAVCASVIERHQFEALNEAEGAEVGLDGAEIALEEQMETPQTYSI